MTQDVRDTRIIDALSNEREAMVNSLIIDMMANTDCSWYAATAAIAFWEMHRVHSTASVYGLVEFGEEKPNVCYEGGKVKRSLKIGVYISGDNEPTWMLTLYS